MKEPNQIVLNDDDFNKLVNRLQEPPKVLIELAKLLNGEIKIK
jgi:predicted nuclease of predicted toxin-antitoxin system